MKNIKIVTSRGVEYEVKNVPEKTKIDTLEKLLSFGIACELEALGIYTLEYSRLETGVFPLVPDMEDYIDALRDIFSCNRQNAKYYISQVTGEKRDMVENWLLGHNKIRSYQKKALRDFIINHRRRQ